MSLIVGQTNAAGVCLCAVHRRLCAIVRSDLVVAAASHRHHTTPHHTTRRCDNYRADLMTAREKPTPSMCALLSE